MIINGLEFRQTCSACPEQYDVYRDDVQVGYVRLRHGFLRADVPHCGGQTVYHRFLRADVPHCGGQTVYATECANGYGCFQSEYERITHLTTIANIISGEEEQNEDEILLRECLAELDPDLELCDRIRAYLGE